MDAALLVLDAPPTYEIRIERGQQVDPMTMWTESPTRHWFSFKNDLLGSSLTSGVSIGGLYEFEYGEITFTAFVEVSLEQGRERVTVEATPPWVAIPFYQEVQEGETVEFLITLMPTEMN